MLYAVNRLQHSMIESGLCIRSKIESFHFYELFFPTSARFSSFPGYTSFLRCTGRIRRGEKPLSEVELAESTPNFPWRQIYASHVLLLFYFLFASIVYIHIYILNIYIYIDVAVCKIMENNVTLLPQCHDRNTVTICISKCQGHRYSNGNMQNDNIPTL